MKEITAYKCEFCKAIQQHLRNARLHEARCFRNPANRACITCAHHGLDWTDGGYPGAVTTAFYVCNAPDEANTEPSWDLIGCHAWADPSTATVDERSESEGK